MRQSYINGFECKKVISVVYCISFSKLIYIFLILLGTYLCSEYYMFRAGKGK
jgi:hypothetical protein